MKRIIRLNESSNIDWVSLIKDGIDNGYIPNEHDENDIPYFTILNYAKDRGYINGSLFQVLNTERYSIKDAYNYCKKNIVETKEYKKTKKIVRITESELNEIVNEAVKKILGENILCISEKIK